MYSQKLFLKVASLLLSGCIFFASCSSSTLIQSVPSGAKLYVDGESVGVTPYKHRDSKVVTSTTDLRFEMEGYKTLYASFSKDEEPNVGAIIGGIFVLIPFLWVMKYKPTHVFELVTLEEENAQQSKIQENKYIDKSDTQSASKSKVALLRDLKNLLDDGAITKSEYEKEKQKILEE